MQQATRLYLQLLRQDPQDAEALHGLGVLANQTGNATLAVQLLAQAIASNASVPRFHNNLGNVLTAQGRLDEAAERYAEAIRLQPGYAEAHHNLGIVCKQQGHLATAVEHFERAVQLKPAYAEAYYHLGNVRLAQGDIEAAIAHYAQALQCKPDLAVAHLNLGHALQHQGQLAPAVASYQQAIQCQPTFAEAYYNLGNVLYRQRQLDAAGLAYTQALALQPDAVETQYNLGNVWREQGDLEAALVHYEQILARRPDYAKGYWGRALAWLGLGKLAQGWPAYEWRWRALQWLPRSLPQPRWDGASLAGRTLLIHAEQGVGDELLFASCFPEVIAQAAHVVVECDARLMPLFRRSFPTLSVQPRYQDDQQWWQHPAAVDVHIPAGSLPALLRHTLGHFPCRAGYLVPDPIRCARWKKRLSTLGPGLKVGIAWRSLASRRGAPHYTCLEQWDGVLQVPGIHWVNLQYDDSASELTAVQQRLGITIHTWSDLDVFHDLEGVAALMSELDLVIAPETMMAVLAASLGQPVWRLSLFTRDWDGLGTEVVPWFPSMRLYRQPQSGDWQSVLAWVAHDLQRLVGSLATIGKTSGDKTLCPGT